MVGLSRERTPLPVLERASLNRSACVQLLEALRSGGTVDGAIVLSTCNRTELYAASVPGRTLSALERLRQALASQTSVSEREIGDLAAVRHERAAVEHFFGVVSGLNSVVLGEPEIVAQARAAIALARDSGMLTSVLSGLADHALAAGRRVRDRTGISRGALSIPSVAVDIGGRLVPDLSATRALVVGAGKMGRAVSRHLVSRGVGELTVTNRSPAPAIAVARDVGGRAVPFDELASEIGRAGIVVCATASPTCVISHRMLAAAVADRHDPLVTLDLAVPRDIEPSARALPGVVLRDLDEIHEAAVANLDERRRELPHAWSIVRSETERFYTWLASLETEPIVAELHRRADEIRADELRLLMADSPALSEAELAWLDAITRSLANKLLYEATERIRGTAGSSRGQLSAVSQASEGGKRPFGAERVASAHLSVVEAIAG